MSKEVELDLKIKTNLELVEKKRLEIAKIEKGSFVTNLILNLDGKSINLNILSVDSIAELAYNLAHEHEKRVLGYELLDLTPPTQSDINGFSLDEWLSDMKTLVKRKSLSEEKRKLSIAEKELSKLLSENAKKENKLNDLLGDLNL